ncbi:MAG: flippase [Chloroflexota bacterium]|nr:flippase [Chloroflexota bacterium]PLS79890.1 MAG: flippase [Chloroflexota bacterium]
MLRRKFTANILYNLLGGIVPLIIAFAAIPFLIRGLGTERFGVLTLIWTILAYFSIFDAGVGRAVTKFVAEHIAQGRNAEIPSLVWTAGALIAIVGIIGGGILAVTTPLVLASVLDIPSALQLETLNSFYCISVAIPFLVLSLGFRGVLEAQRRFDTVNLVLIPCRSLNYLGPVLLLQFAQRLDVIAAFLLLNQMVMAITLVYLCIRSISGVPHYSLLDKQYIRPLLSYGGWLTVSSIVSPFMEYIDRVIVGAMLTLSAVAYYTTPYESVSKLMFLPVAVTGVLFPVFSSLVVSRPEEAADSLFRAVKLLVITLVPLVLTLLLLSDTLLTAWVGAKFAQHSVGVLRWLIVGCLLFNALGRIFTNWTHAHNRPDVTAKVHLLELPVYLMLLWYLVHQYGIVGAAVAWVARALVDMIFLSWFSFCYLGNYHHHFLLLLRWLGLIVVACCAVVVLSELLPQLLIRLAMLLAILIVYSITTWRLILSADERQIALSQLTVIKSNIYPSR